MAEMIMANEVFNFFETVGCGVVPVVFGLFLICFFFILLRKHK